ncbi:hypothetical protein [Actinocrispum sp. NPDC049592]|uniref:hypothetical protein n=1 Tax=Actinocrispum sp. NPDC049592 TaxID=3154835 RepID=UPI003424B0AE
MAAGRNGSWSGGGASDGELLVDTADRLRWRAPELALEFARQAAIQADTAQDRALSLRARALMVAALVRLGKHAEAVQPAVLALREAESVGLRDFAAPIRVDLAASTRAVGLAGSAFVLVRPMLEGGDARPAVRAGALAEIVAGLAQAGRRTVADEVLSEADRLYSGDESLTGDIRRVLRALLCARTSSFRRRWGNPEGAVAAATEGMMLLDGLSDARVESGQARAELGLEMVTALLDAGEKAAALGQADQTLEQPVRAPTAAAVGRLMFILATRVYLPDGRVPEAHAAFAEIARIARRHGLDALLADVLTSLAHEQEAAGELTDALESLRSARAAEHRRLRADTMARLIVLEELGAGTRLPADTESLLRRVVRTPARAAELAVGEPLWPEQSAEDTGDRDTETGLLNRQGLRRRLAAARRQTRPTALTLVRFEPEPEPPLRSDDPDSTDRFSASLIDSLDKTGRRTAPEVDPGVLSSLVGHVGDMAPDRAELIRPNEDELAVLMPDTTKDEAEQFASTLRDNMSTSDWAPDDPAWGVHVSTGVAEYQDGTSEDTLLNAAREAMTTGDYETGDNAERPAWQSVEPVYDLPPDEVPFGDVESRDDGYTYIEEYASGPADEPERDPEMDAYLAGFSLPEYGQWAGAPLDDQDVEPDSAAPKHGAAPETPGQSVLDRLGITQRGGSGGGRRRAPDTFAQDNPSDDYTPPSDPAPSTEPWLDETQPPGDDTETPSRGFTLTAPTNKDDDQTPSPQPRGRRYRQTPDTAAESDPGGLGGFQQNASPDPGPVPDPLPRRRFQPESDSMVFNDPLGLDEYHRTISSGISPESSGTNLFAAGDDDLPEVGTGSRRNLSSAFGTNRTPESVPTDEEQVSSESGQAFGGGFSSRTTGFGPVERASAETGADAAGFFGSAQPGGFGLIEGDSAARDMDSPSTGFGQSGLRRRLGRRFGGGATADSGGALSDQDSGSRKLPGTDGLEAMRGRRRSRRMDPDGTDTGEQSDEGPGSLAGLAGLTGLPDDSPGVLGFPASVGWPAEPPGIDEPEEDNAGHRTRPRFEPIDVEIVGAQFNPEYDTYLPDLDQIRKSGSAGDAVLAAAASRASIPEPPQPDEIPVPPPTPDIPTPPNPDTDPTPKPSPGPKPKSHPDHPSTPPAETPWTPEPETLHPPTTSESAWSPAPGTNTLHPSTTPGPDWPSASATPSTTHPPTPPNSDWPSASTYSSTDASTAPGSDWPSASATYGSTDSSTAPGSDWASPLTTNTTHPEPPSTPDPTWPPTFTTDTTDPEQPASPQRTWPSTPATGPAHPGSPTAAHRADWHPTSEPEATDSEQPTQLGAVHRAAWGLAPESPAADSESPALPGSARADWRLTSEPEAAQDEPEPPVATDYGRRARRSAPEPEPSPFTHPAFPADQRPIPETEARHAEPPASNDPGQRSARNPVPGDPEPSAFTTPGRRSAPTPEHGDPEPSAFINSGRRSDRRPPSEPDPDQPEQSTFTDPQSRSGRRSAPDPNIARFEGAPFADTGSESDWQSRSELEALRRALSDFADLESGPGWPSDPEPPAPEPEAVTRSERSASAASERRLDWHSTPQEQTTEPEPPIADGTSQTRPSSAATTDATAPGDSSRRVPPGAERTRPAWADAVDSSRAHSSKGPGADETGDQNQSGGRAGTRSDADRREAPDDYRGIDDSGQRSGPTDERTRPELPDSSGLGRLGRRVVSAWETEQTEPEAVEPRNQPSSEPGRRARFEPGDFEPGQQVSSGSEPRSGFESGRRVGSEPGHQVGHESGGESGRRVGSEGPMGSELGRRAGFAVGADPRSGFDSGSDSSASPTSSRRAAYDLEASLRSDDARSRRGASADADSGGTVLRPVFDPESARRMASQGGRVISPGSPAQQPARDLSGEPDLRGEPEASRTQKTTELPRTAQLRAQGEPAPEGMESRRDRAQSEPGPQAVPEGHGLSARGDRTQGQSGEGRPRAGSGTRGGPEVQGTTELPRPPELRGERVPAEPRPESAPEGHGVPARGDRAQGQPAPDMPGSRGEPRTRAESEVRGGPDMRGTPESQQPGAHAAPDMPGTPGPWGEERARTGSGARGGPNVQGTPKPGTRAESEAGRRADVQGTPESREPGAQAAPEGRGAIEVQGTPEPGTRAESEAGRRADVQGTPESREPGAQAAPDVQGTREPAARAATEEKGTPDSEQAAPDSQQAAPEGQGTAEAAAETKAEDRSAWRRQLAAREGTADRSAWRRELRNRAAAAAGGGGGDSERPSGRRRGGIDSGSDSDGSPGRALPPEPADPVDPLGSAESPESAGRPSRLRRREKTDVGLAELLAEALVAYQTSHSDTDVEDVLPPYDDPSDSGRHRPGD